MININSNKGIITIDTRLKQIRIVKGKSIKFIDLTDSEIFYLTYWYDKPFKDFCPILKEVLGEHNFIVKKLEEMKGGLKE